MHNNTLHCPCDTIPDQTIPYPDITLRHDTLPMQYNTELYFALLLTVHVHNYCEYIDFIIDVIQVKDHFEHQLPFSVTTLKEAYDKSIQFINH